MGDLVKRDEHGDVICDDPLFRCRCVKPAGHDDDVHACADECGGSWSWREDGVTFDVHSYPKGEPYGSLPVEWIDERDGVPFVEGGPVSAEVHVPIVPDVPFPIRAQRGGIRILEPPPLP